MNHYTLIAIACFVGALVCVMRGLLADRHTEAELRAGDILARRAHASQLDSNRARIVEMGYTTDFVNPEDQAAVDMLYDSFLRDKAGRN